MSPSTEKNIAIVTLHCPTCPRRFRTLEWIALQKMPTCPNCSMLMKCSDVQDVSVLSQPLHLRRSA